MIIKFKYFENLSNIISVYSIPWNVIHKGGYIGVTFFWAVSLKLRSRTQTQPQPLLILKLFEHKLGYIIFDKR